MATARQMSQPDAWLRYDRARRGGQGEPVAPLVQILAVGQTGAIQITQMLLIGRRERGELSEEHGQGHGRARDDHLGQVAKLRKPGSGATVTGLCLLGQIRHVQDDQRIALIAAGGRLDCTVRLTDQPLRRIAQPGMGASKQRTARCHRE